MTRCRPRRPADSSASAAGSAQPVPGLARPVSWPSVGTRDRDRCQPGGQRGLGEQARVLVGLGGEEVEPVIVDQVRVGDHAQRPGRHRGQVREALHVGRVDVQQLRGQDPLGQVVDPAPARPPHADHIADVQQPLHRDLDVRPVPPRAAALGPARAGWRSAGPRRAAGPAPCRRSPGGSGAIARPGPGTRGAGRRSTATARSAARRPRAPSTRRRRAWRVPVSLLDLLPGHWPSRA